MTMAAVKSMVDDASTPQEMGESPLHSLNIRELLSREIPPRKIILSPWLPSQGLAMIYAARGVGKTHVALEVAYAVASGGSFLKWKAETPHRVLYLDGEMPLIAMQERLARIVRDAAAEPPAPDYLRLVNPDLQERGFNLATDEGRQRLEPLLPDVSLVVVDNISTLASFGRENEAESWLPLQEWALDLRRRGLSVLFIHHAGKGGAQRGTSRREDVLDTVIALKRPDDYDPRNGAQFEVHFEKCRAMVGDDAAPFDVNLSPQGWTWKALEDARAEKILALQAEGLSQTEIAEELGIHKSNVSRTLKRLKAEASA